MKNSLSAIKINIVKKLLNALKGRKHICFLDFEGTQYSHEMIAFGAVFVSLNKDGTVKNCKKPIRFLVQSKNKVGKFVENLTGITDYDVKQRGIPFAQAIKEIKKYCGLHFAKTVFMTFGNHDFRIFNQSISYNLDSPKEYTSVIHKGFFDFQNFIMEFVKDDAGNPYSLENYLKVYDIVFEGTTHDPQDDAYNLMLLYNAFLTKSDITLREYIKILSKGNNMPVPVRELVKKVAAGETVSSADFIKFAKEYIS